MLAPISDLFLFSSFAANESTVKSAIPRASANQMTGSINPKT
ncbi:MAG: hypothetical protein RLZZ129_2203 [Verrucomicrobiota bacterium]